MSTNYDAQCISQKKAAQRAARDSRYALCVAVLRIGALGFGMDQFRYQITLCYAAVCDQAFKSCQGLLVQLNRDFFAAILYQVATMSLGFFSGRKCHRYTLVKFFA